MTSMAASAADYRSTRSAAFMVQDFEVTTPHETKLQCEDALPSSRVDNDEPTKTDAAGRRRRERRPAPPPQSRSADDHDRDDDPSASSGNGAPHARDVVVASAGGGDGTAGRTVRDVVSPPTKVVVVVDDDDDEEEEEDYDDGDSDDDDPEGDDGESRSDAPDLILPPTSSRRRRSLHEAVESRRRLLARLLRGREGTAYAESILGREELANARLLLLLDLPLPAAARPRTTTARDVIRDALLEECHHALPAALSLVLHCVLYIRFYSMISAFADWVCYSVVIARLPGSWDADGFHAAVLFLSLMATRVTGTVYQWNDNVAYQRLIALQLRNKWHLRSWDAEVMNFFHGDAIRSKYGMGVGEDEDRVPRKRRAQWGCRMKRVLDLFSFFLCYKSVEHFLWRIGPTPPAANVDAGVRASDASPPPGRGGRLSRGRLHVSHACPTVASALANPYASDVLNWIARSEFDSEEARGWMTNAMNCGWSGPPTVGGVEIDANDDDRPRTVDGNERVDSSDVVEASESDRPTPITNDGIAAGDDEHRTVVPAGHLITEFVHQSREPLFLLASTAMCLGLLYACDIPFLLI